MPVRVGLLTVLALVLGGCGGDEGSKATAPPKGSTAPADSTYPYTNPIGRKGSSPPRLGGDGRYFGYVRAADAGAQTISFDVAQFFFGEDVQKAAEEDGVVAPGEPVPNDHYERNPEQDVESLKIAPRASITAAWPASFLMEYVSRETYEKCEKGARAADFPMACLHVPLRLARFFRAMRELPSERYGIPAWVTIDRGRVVRIDEQYFP